MDKLETIILRGNRISKAVETVRILKNMKELQVIDLRHVLFACFFLLHLMLTRIAN